MNKFAERLRETLRQSGISQSELARRLKMSYQGVNDYCTGKNEPPLDTLLKISKVLEETVGYLLGEDEFRFDGDAC